MLAELLKSDLKDSGHGAFSITFTVFSALIAIGLKPFKDGLERHDVADASGTSADLSRTIQDLRDTVATLDERVLRLSDTIERHDHGDGYTKA